MGVCLQAILTLTVLEAHKLNRIKLGIYPFGRGINKCCPIPRHLKKEIQDEPNLMAFL